MVTDKSNVESKSRYPRTGKYYPKSTCERGEFWMSWSDWSERFDILNICYIPDERKGINYRIIGDFNPKLNSPLDLPDMKKYYLRSGS